MLLFQENACRSPGTWQLNQIQLHAEAAKENKIHWWGLCGPLAPQAKQVWAKMNSSLLQLTRAAGLGWWCFAVLVSRSIIRPWTFILERPLSRITALTWFSVARGAAEAAQDTIDKHLARWRPGQRYSCAEHLGLSAYVGKNTTLLHFHSSHFEGDDSSVKKIFWIYAQNNVQRVQNSNNQNKYMQGV